jgi:hypothetical protein
MHASCCSLLHRQSPDLIADGSRRLGDFVRLERMGRWLPAVARVCALLQSVSATQV